VKSVFRLLISIFILLILPACQPKLKPAELDILGTESCQPSCWRGIIPGETTAEDTIKVLQGWQTNGKGTWKRNTGNKDDLHWDYICWLEEVWPEICLTINDNVVSKVSLNISSPSSLKLRDVIDKYGHPDGYTLTLCPDCSDYGVFLYYPDRGIIVLAGSNWLTRLKNREVGQLVLSPDMKITHAIFTEQMDREEILKFSFGSNADIQLILKNYYPWNGYGAIPQSTP
jgi:hypothetical protein